MNSDSPCIGICTIDSRRICIGCQRTLQEIACWSAASHVERRRILADVEKRKTDAAEPTADRSTSDPSESGETTSG